MTDGEILTIYMRHENAARERIAKARDGLSMVHFDDTCRECIGLTAAECGLSQEETACRLGLWWSMSGS
jgi:Mg-chelatase subunit ChlI